MSDSRDGNLAARANRLYWHTDRSAADVAEELGISRSKLYAVIDPLPLDEVCEICGGSLVFTNRTDREGGRAHCSSCGAILDVAPQPLQNRVVSDRRDDDQASSGYPSPTFLQDLSLGALCGLAVGLLAGTWVRRR